MQPMHSSTSFLSREIGSYRERKRVHELYIMKIFNDIFPNKKEGHPGN